MENMSLEQSERSQHDVLRSSKTKWISTLKIRTKRNRTLQSSYSKTVVTVSELSEKGVKGSGGRGRRFVLQIIAYLFHVEIPVHNREWWCGYENSLRQG